VKILLLYPYPPEPDGISLQGYYLSKGLKENGANVVSCERKNSLEKDWQYESFKPDITIGVGFWGDTPDLILDPLKHGIQPVPWLNADGWIANYQDILNSLPLITVPSNWVKSTYIRDGIKGDNIRILHIGYDPDIFYPLPEDDLKILKIRELLGIRKDEIMILTAGGDATSKGAQEMLQALSKIDQEFPKWKYVLKIMVSYSSRNHGKEERKLIHDLNLDKNKIVYLEGKYSPEFIAQLIRACDIYAAPSRLESFGMLQLEAQACGKPVISINVGGPKDTIIHNETGFLVDVASEIKLTQEWVYQRMGFDKKHLIKFSEPKTFAYRANIEQLTNYTRMLLSDKSIREKIGRAAAEHVRKNFNYRLIAEKMLKLINSCV